MSSMKDGNFFDSNSLYNFVVGDKNKTLDMVVTHLLAVLGFRTNLIGTYYLKDAIMMLYELPVGVKVNLSSDIYKSIAESKGSTTACVERDIRNCIRDSYFSGKLFVFNSFAHCERISSNCPTTNAELINDIVSWLRIAIQTRSTQ